MKYTNVWLAFVDIQAQKGKKFIDLIELDGNNDNYIGAWSNILVINNRINEVPEIVEKGLNELGMTIKFIDKIENISSLIEYNEIDENLLCEVEWLLSTNYIFKISGNIFPYSNIPN